MSKSLFERLSKKNILIIDDDGLITRTLCNLLQKEGYFASGTESSSDAIEQTQESDYDLIIADIRMPELDGVETINRIHALSKERNKPNAPVVFITGYANDESVQQAKQLGEVIFKPFDTSEFLNRITKYLN